MADELQPLEAPITAGPTTTETTTNTITTTTTAATTTAQPSSENTGLPVAPKRQRRPSVRLGEIGDQPAATVSYDPQLRRGAKHPWRYTKDSSSKAVKARSLTNLVNGGGDSHENPEPEERNQNGEGSNFEFGNRSTKAKRGTVTKRARSNWISNSNSKLDDGGADGDSREYVDDGFRDFDPDSDSPLKDHSPVHSVDNTTLDMWNGHRRSVGRTRILESRENDAVELDNTPEYSFSRVRSWLIELGLSRYTPVFEIHEVDDEVLPMLTLEDLKDMGINAVGSRRKMYTAIQKLRKGFS